MAEPWKKYEAAPAAGPWTKYATPPPAAPAEDHGAIAKASGAYYEGVGGRAVMDMAGMASRDPQRIEKGKETAKAVIHGLTNEGPRVMNEVDSAGSSLLKGNLKDAAYHALGSAPVIGAPMQQIASEIDEKEYAKAFGHFLALATPFLTKGAGPLARAAAETDTGAAMIGGVKGAAKAAIETKPLTIKGISVPMPTAVASSAAGGAATSMMGLGHTPGAIVGAAVPIVRGAVRGGKAALAERALVRDAAAIPTDVMEQLLRDSEAPVPQEAPIQVPQGQPIPTRMTQAEDLAAMERLRQDQANYTPAHQPKLLAPGPQVTQMPEVPDPSYVRSGPLEQKSVTPEQTAAMEAVEARQQKPAITPQMSRTQMEEAGLPKNATPDDIAELLHRTMRESGTIENAPPPKANPFEAKARAAKVAKLADALNEAGQGYDVMSKLSKTQLDAAVQGAARMIGEKEFSPESISDLMTELQRPKPKPPARARAAAKGKK